MEKVQERRAFTRAMVRLECEVGQNPGEVLRLAGWVSNVSMGGVFLRSDRALPEGTECYISILLGKPEINPVLRVSGRVVRSEPSGMGVEFRDLPNSSYDHLRNLVLYHAQDPDLVEQELNVKKTA